MHIKKGGRGEEAHKQDKKQGINTKNGRQERPVEKGESKKNRKKEKLLKGWI